MGLELINEVRKQKKISIEELSLKSGVPKSTLSKITAGITKNPNLETVRAIAQALDLSLDDLDQSYKKTPPTLECEEGYTDEDFETAVKLYRVFVNAGLIEKGQDLTNRQVDFLDGLCSIIRAFFNSSNK